jgi:hypothetical protein
VIGELITHVFAWKSGCVLSTEYQSRVLMSIQIHDMIRQITISGQTIFGDNAPGHGMAAAAVDLIAQPDDRPHWTYQTLSMSAAI